MQSDTFKPDEVVLLKRQLAAAELQLAKDIEFAKAQLARAQELARSELARSAPVPLPDGGQQESCSPASAQRLSEKGDCHAPLGVEESAPVLPTAPAPPTPAPVSHLPPSVLHREEVDGGGASSSMAKAESERERGNEALKLNPPALKVALAAYTEAVR